MPTRLGQLLMVGEGFTCRLEMGVGGVCSIVPPRLHGVEVASQRKAGTATESRVGVLRIQELRPSPHPASPQCLFK